MFDVVDLLFAHLDRGWLLLKPQKATANKRFEIKCFKAIYTV